MLCSLQKKKEKKKDSTNNKSLWFKNVEKTFKGKPKLQQNKHQQNTKNIKLYPKVWI